MSWACNDKVKIKALYWKGYTATVVSVPEAEDEEYYTVSLDEEPKHLLKFTAINLAKPDEDIKKYQVCGKIVV